MTYEQLAERISKMTPEQKGSTVTLMDHDEEFFDARLQFNDETEDNPSAGILDENHPFLSPRTLV